MKLLLKLTFSVATLFVSSSYADTYVNGYTRSNGTYVKPHYRSDSNGTKSDNWSTKGNVNPYTGAYGTKNSYGTNSGSSSSSGYYNSSSSWDD